MQMSHGYFRFSLLQNCTIDRHLQDVSRHAHVGHLRLSAVNVSDAFCVLFRTFVFEKVHMDFMIFGFCSVTYMNMYHNFYLMIKNQYTGINPQKALRCLTSVDKSAVTTKASIFMSSKTIIDLNSIIALIIPTIHDN